MEKEIERDTTITLKEGGYYISWHDPGGHPLTIGKEYDGEPSFVGSGWIHTLDGQQLRSLQNLITKFFEEIDAPNTPPRP